VHSEGLGFADNGADSTAPAFPGIDDSLQLLRAFYLAYLDCVKLAPLQAVLASNAQRRINSGFVAAPGEYCIVGHTAYVGGVPDGTAAAAAYEVRAYHTCAICEGMFCWNGSNPGNL